MCCETGGVVKKIVRPIWVIPVVIGVVLGLWNILSSGHMPTEPEYWTGAMANVKAVQDWMRVTVDEWLKRK